MGLPAQEGWLKWQRRLSQPVCRGRAGAWRGSKQSLGWSDSSWLLVIDGHLEKLPQTYMSVKTHQTPTVPLTPVHFAVGNYAPHTHMKRVGVGGEAVT